MPAGGCSEDPGGADQRDLAPVAGGRGPPLAAEHPGLHPPQAGHPSHLRRGQRYKEDCRDQRVSTAAEEPSHHHQHGRNDDGYIR